MTHLEQFHVQAVGFAVGHPRDVVGDDAVGLTAEAVTDVVAEVRRWVGKS